MLEKIKRYREILAFLTYGLVFIVVSSLFIQGHFSDSTILNFRPQASKPRMTELVSSLQNRDFTKKNIIPGDDPGFMFIYIASSLLEGNQTPSVSTDARNFSTTFHFIQILTHLIFIALLITAPLLNFTTKLALLFFLISPNLLAVFWGFDIYLFPLYAAIVSLYSIGHLKRGSLSTSKFLVCSVLVVICETLRKNSFLLFLPVLGYVIVKKNLTPKYKGILLSTFVMVFISIKLIVSFGYNTKGHTVWHSLHAGLFEVGGCVDKKGESYPFFIHDINSLKKEDMVFCSPTWDDVFEYTVAEQHGIKEYFTSDAYNQILKKQTIQIVTGHPSEVLGLIMMRLMNILNFSPFKSHTRLGSVRGNELESLVMSFLFLLVYMLWFIKEKDQERKYLYTVMLITAMTPPLLVHSGHTIYNAGANFIQCIILMEAGELFLKSLKTRSGPALG